MRLFEKKIIITAVLIFLFTADFFLFAWYFIRRFVYTKPHPGSCLILEEKFCQKAKPIPYNNRFLGFSFDLPTGTAVFSPINGRLIPSTVSFQKNGKSYPFKALQLQNNNQGYILIFERDKIKDERQIKTQEVIGVLRKKPINIYGKANLIIYAVYKNEKGLWASNEKLTRQLFAKTTQKN